MSASSSAHAPRLRIGTRASPLALRQAEIVRAALVAAHPALAGPGAIAIIPMRTTGDNVQDRTLYDIGGKGLFTKEIEEALLGGQCDIGVHSMKDMPTRLPPGLVLGAFLRREDPRDALITAGAARAATSIAALPAGTVVGTSSLRRKALLLARRPDLQVQPLRGNVDTRLRKLEEGQVQATLLAVAGLKRLGREHIGYPIAIEEMLPAVGQGAICVEHREGDSATAALLEAINHWPTAQCVLAEHALLSVLDGSCRTPIGGHAEIDGQRMRLRAVIAKPDGSAQHATERTGSVGDGIAMGSDAAEELKRRGGPDFFTA